MRNTGKRLAYRGAVTSLRYPGQEEGGREEGQGGRNRRSKANARVQEGTARKGQSRSGRQGKRSPAVNGNCRWRLGGKWCHRMELLHECMMKLKEEEEKIHELIIMLFFLHYEDILQHIFVRYIKYFNLYLLYYAVFYINSFHYLL